MDPEIELQLEETGWHDGNVRRLEVQMSERGMEVTLEVDIYEEPYNTPDRHRLFVKLTKVRELAVVGTAEELLLNFGAGHIVSARLGGLWPDPSSRSRKKKLPPLDLNVYLCGGYIRVLADAYEVVEVRRPRKRRRGVRAGSASA